MTRQTLRRSLAVCTLVAGLSLTSYTPAPQPGAYQSLPVAASKLEELCVLKASAVSHLPNSALLFAVGAALVAGSLLYKRKTY